MINDVMFMCYRDWVIASVVSLVRVAASKFMLSDFYVSGVLCVLKEKTGNSCSLPLLALPTLCSMTIKGGRGA